MTPEKVEKIAPIVDKIKKYLRQGFYFAHNFELTLNAQKRAKFAEKEEESPTKRKILGDTSVSDSRYVWNYNLLKDFRAQKISEHWFVKLVQGYVDYQCPRDGLELLLIARRRWAMGGTRYNARGIDHEGNVANHVELEQLIFQHEVHDPPLPFEDQPNSHVLGSTSVYSHVQIRGSLPFFWN